MFASAANGCGVSDSFFFLNHSRSAVTKSCFIAFFFRLGAETGATVELFPATEELVVASVFILVGNLEKKAEASECTVPDSANEHLSLMSDYDLQLGCVLDEMLVSELWNSMEEAALVGEIGVEVGTGSDFLLGVWGCPNSSF